MLVLGLQGSPRKGGNTDTFLTAFMEKAGQAGAVTETIQAAKAGIVPCKGCGYCEKHGTCIIADDPMSESIYGLLRQADLIVAASPVYFYGISAQLKILIDRCQTLWSRKYICKLEDPLASSRQGLLFSVAASRGRQIFDGTHLTAKYFFDAIDARLNHTITYRGIEAKGAIRRQDGWVADIEAAIETLVVPGVGRSSILFVSQQGACLAPMAAAMVQKRFGNRIRAGFAGWTPAAALYDPMVRVMQHQGVDLGYLRPQPLADQLESIRPDKLVLLGESCEKMPVQEIQTEHWPIAGWSATTNGAVERMQKEIEEHMNRLIAIDGLNFKQGERNG